MWRPFRTSVRFVEMDFMTDIHSHILSGVDDGFQSEDRSFRALELLHGLGLRHALLTPHIYPELYPGNSYGTIVSKFGEVKDSLREASGINFLPGGEHMVYEGFEDTFSGEMLLLPGKHILIEMSYAYESANLDETVFRLICMGYNPVLAHPERYLFYPSDLVRIREIVDKGCKLQLNLLSLGGFYGKGAAVKARAILERGLYSFAGTDLHSLAQIDMLRSMRFRRRHVPELERIMLNTTKLFLD